MLSCFFLKKSDGDIAIASVCLSVCLSCYLLLNHWTKSNQIWCVSCPHEWGVQWHNFFLPHPLEPWGGAKRSNINSQLQSRFSTLDKQRICINTQLKSSKKQSKLNVYIPKSNSNDRYAITCDVNAYHLVHFVSIWVINKCQSGIDFIFTSERAI